MDTEVRKLKGEARQMAMAPLRQEAHARASERMRSDPVATELRLRHKKQGRRMAPIPAGLYSERSRTLYAEELAALVAEYNAANGPLL